MSVKLLSLVSIQIILFYAGCQQTCIDNKQTWYAYVELWQSGYSLAYSYISHIYIYIYVDGLVQERCNSIAKALELHLSCTNPSICSCKETLYLESFFTDICAWESS